GRFLARDAAIRATSRTSGARNPAKRAPSPHAPRAPRAPSTDASTARRHHPFTRPGQTASMSTPEEASTPTPDATANSGAVAVIGLDLRGDTPAPRKQVYSWALWDWATQPFNTVILTFIFAALYLTTEAFLPADIAALDSE